MCLLLWFLVSLNSATCSFHEERSERIERAVGHSEQYIKQIYYAHANCTRTDWACNKECRLEFANRVTGLCVRPSPSESCFGIPIRYNYTLEGVNVISTLSRYEILSKFPRCWSVLGPLLCAVAYRPCSNRTYFEISMPEPGKMELWQVLRKDMCYRAVEKCSFLLENGLWPNFINCSDTVEQKHGRRIFSDGSCKMPYDKEPSAMKSKQCLWPMVDGMGHIRPMSWPVIDDCYLPCRSPLISSQWLYDGFKMLIFCFSVFVVICGLVCVLYLSVFSVLFVNDLCIYSLTHALLSASVHWFLWLLSYFDRLAERAMCFDKLRRDETVVRGSLDWCTIQSWILHSTAQSAFFWLLLTLTIQSGKPNLNSDQTVKWNQHCNLNLRCFFLIHYLFAGFVATVGLWTNVVETDGVTGVCYLGLRTFSSAVQLYCPVLFAVLLSMITIIFLRRNDKALSTSRNHDCMKKKLSSLDERDRLALVEEESGGAKSFDGGDFQKKAYSQMSFFWLGLLCGVTMISLASAMFIHYHFLINAVSEREVVIHSLRCSLNRTILEGQTDWLHGTMNDNQVDIYKRRASIGNSASGCELPSSMDNRLLLLFLVYLFLPSLPFLSIIIFVLVGFCGYGFVDIVKVRENLNPFILVSYSEGAVTARQKHASQISDEVKQCSGLFLEEQGDVKGCKSYEQERESRDMFVSDSKIRKLDVLQRSRERRRRQMENGFLMSGITNPAQLMNKESGQLYNPVWPNLQEDMRNAYCSLTSSNCVNGNNQGDSLLQATTMLSAYQNGLIEGHWRERCTILEKQIKALSANLRLADHEIRRLVGLRAQTAASGESDTAALVSTNHSPTSNVTNPHPVISAHGYTQPGRHHISRDTKYSTNDRTDNIQLMKKPSCSSKISLGPEFCVAGTNEKELDQTLSAKPKRLFGVTDLHNSSSKISNETDEQVSGSCSNSDNFNSDEEDSEEERMLSERMAELGRN